MDPNNAVVKLWVEGMAEADGKPDEAPLLFMQAWEQSKEDYKACIATHYIARH